MKSPLTLVPSPNLLQHLHGDWKRQLRNSNLDPDLLRHQILEDLPRNRFKLMEPPFLCVGSVAYALMYCCGVGPGGIKPTPQLLSFSDNNSPAIAAHLLWELGGGIYRFQENLAQSILATADSPLPTSILRRLPEWGPCLALGMEGNGFRSRYALVHREYDTRERDLGLLRHQKGAVREEIALVIGFEQGEQTSYLSLQLPLSDTPQPIETLLRESLRISSRYSTKIPGTVPASPDHIAAQYEPFLPFAKTYLHLAYYLCSEQPDINWHRPPVMPEFKKTRKGTKLFPNHPKIWDVGVRIGPIFQTNQHQPAESHMGTGPSKRPHLRRAHFHLYWTGAGRKNPKIRWVHPVLVKAGFNEPPPPTIRRVE